MDVDVRPPLSPAASLRSFRPGSIMASAKRARSPETALEFDRPAKRLVLGMREDAMDSADFSDGSFGVVHSASSSRFPSEDWVRQANGLSIGNATPYESRSTNSSIENLRAQSGDVDMMDSEENDGSNTQTQSLYPSPNHPYQAEARQYANLPQRLLPHLFQKSVHPEINVTPATPSSTAPTSVSSSTHDLHELRSSLNPTEGSMMSLSPTPSFSEALSPQSPLRNRPKFSMGPRQDCEKCRLGVKGHWAHFD